MPFVLAMDFDDTVYNYHTEEKISEVIAKVKEFKEHGASIILWTCREGKLLEEAIEKCKEFGIELDAVNENAPCNKKYLKTKEPLATRKVLADFYLDDKSLNIDTFLRINIAETCKKFANR